MQKKKMWIEVDAEFSDDADTRLPLQIAVFAQTRVLVAIEDHPDVKIKKVTLTIDKEVSPDRMVKAVKQELEAAEAMITAEEEAEQDAEAAADEVTPVADTEAVAKTQTK